MPQHWVSFPFFSKYNDVNSVILEFNVGRPLCRKLQVTNYKELLLIAPPFAALLATLLRYDLYMTEIISSISFRDFNKFS